MSVTSSRLGFQKLVLMPLQPVLAHWQLHTMHGQQLTILMSGPF